MMMYAMASIKRLLMPNRMPRNTASQRKKNTGFKKSLDATLWTIENAWTGININIIPTSILTHTLKMVLLTRIPCIKNTGTMMVIMPTELCIMLTIDMPRLRSKARIAKEEVTKCII